MKNGSIFSLHGITGMLIATALLLSILAGLTVWAINVQQMNAGTYYQIDSAETLHSCTAFTTGGEGQLSMAECQEQNSKHRKLTIVR